MNNQKVLGFWGGPLAGGLEDYADEHAIRYTTSNLKMRKGPSTTKAVITTIPKGSKVAMSTLADDKVFLDADQDLFEEQGVEYNQENLPHTSGGLKWAFISYPSGEDKYGWAAEKYLSPTKPKSKPTPTPTSTSTTTSDTPTVVKDDKKTQQAGIGTGGTFAMVALVGVVAYFLFSKKK